MKQKFSIKTPAKINLILRVLGKREDGYHNVETILQMIGIYDSMDFEPAPSGIEFHCNEPKIPKDEKNLVLKAARILKRYYPEKTRSGVKIHLKKNIPSGAGLAGGSGNAAGALLALNRFWDLQIKRDKLVSLATHLGSDVPFFLISPCAFGTGRGEKLISLKPFQKFSIVVVYPKISIETARVYGKLNLKLTKKENNISILRNFLSISDASQLGSFLRNDLEPVVFKNYPEVLDVKNRLRGSGAEGVLMTGSGSAVFGIFSDLERAKQVYAILEQELISVFLAQSIQAFSEFMPEDFLHYP